MPDQPGDGVGRRPPGGRRADPRRGRRWTCFDARRRCDRRRRGGAWPPAWAPPRRSHRRRGPQGRDPPSGHGTRLATPGNRAWSRFRSSAGWPRAAQSGRWPGEPGAEARAPRTGLSSSPVGLARPRPRLDRLTSATYRRDRLHPGSRRDRGSDARWSSTDLQVPPPGRIGRRQDGTVSLTPSRRKRRTTFLDQGTHGRQHSQSGSSSSSSSSRWTTTSSNGSAQHWSIWARSATSE